MAPPIRRDNPLTRSKAGLAGMAFLAFMLLACLVTLPWTLGEVRLAGPEAGAEGGAGQGVPRYNAGQAAAGRLPPFWVSPNPDQHRRLNEQVPRAQVEAIAQAAGMDVEEALKQTTGPVAEQLREHWPSYVLGTDVLGRSLLIRCLTGGGISLGIGLAAAFISVLIGTLYGALSGYAGGRVDAVMMRVVDVLYGLPYILLVVLLAVASDALVDEYLSRNKARTMYVQAQAQAALEAQQRPATPRDVRILVDRGGAQVEAWRVESERVYPSRQISEGSRTALDVVTLLVAIGGVSWLTMARVIRGQVLSLKSQPFVEAARALGLSRRRIFLRHLLPNLMGPIIVYATLTVPQAILQESFLSFLGIGVKPPLPSWGNLAADALVELNPYESNWWLLAFPCLLLGSTLLALNFVGEGLREALDPKRARR